MNCDMEITKETKLSDLLGQYRKLRDEAQELVIAQSNIGSIFEYGNEKVREQEKEMQKR